MRSILVNHLNTPRWAVLRDDDQYNIMFGDIYRLPADVDARPHHLDPTKMLAPVLPGKILAVGLNYKDHVKEMGHDEPTDPVLFLKPPSALVGPGAAILLPPQSERVDHEAELAVVLKKRLKNATVEEAQAAIWASPASTT